MMTTTAAMSRPARISTGGGCMSVELDTNCTNLHESRNERTALQGRGIPTGRFLHGNPSSACWLTSAATHWNGNESFYEIRVNSCNSCQQPPCQLRRCVWNLTRIARICTNREMKELLYKEEVF